MDLFAIMEDRHMLQCMARDLANDVAVVGAVKQVSIFGDEPMDHQFDHQGLQKRLADTAERGKLWELQYLFLVAVFLSDSAVKWLTSVVATDQIRVWFDGHRTLPDFRTRFATHLMGKFSKKAKKGSRKRVLMEATPPQMAAVSEFLLAHTIVSFTQ